MADDPYQMAAKSKLKLKGDLPLKKKKKRKDKERIEVLMKTIESDKKSDQKHEIKRTKAELSFKKMQEKNQTKRIMEKANMTHKERVEKFNQHLDSLTEHFDIPKVSWTK